MIKADLPEEIQHEPCYSSSSAMLETLKNEFYLVEIEKLKNIFSSKYTDSCYEMVLLFRQPSQLQHNVAISVEHIVFEVIKRCIVNIDEICKRKFSSYEELIVIISSSLR